MDEKDIFYLTRRFIDSFTGSCECSEEEIMPIAYMVIKAALSIGRWAEVNGMPDPSNGEEALALLIKFLSDMESEDDEFLDRVADKLTAIMPTIDKLNKHGRQEEAGD